MIYLVLTLATATLFLMALGSATRVMEAGLACPDWPLCFGQFVPEKQMNLQVFLEWFHRLIATGIGLAMIAAVSLSWWQRHHLPSWFPRSISLALLLVILQGILGGLTVTQMLRFDIVTAHLGTGLLFFSTLLTLGLLLLPYRATGTVQQLPWLGVAAVGLVYGQSLLGGLLASRWAVHQCLNASQLCAILNSHLIGVVPASLGTLVTVVVAMRTPALNPVLRKIAHGAGFLLLLQIGLGVATFRLHLQIAPLTVAHQAIGAALLGALVGLTVLSFRDRHQFNPLP
ncbi:MAG: COX15/CtaA family protein [Cyanobacteria bacterium LVE1205-1]